MDVNSKTEVELRHETEKWYAKVIEKRKKIKSKSEYMKNIDAYISDSQHFLKKGDLIRAFESVVWAWAWIEILEDLKIISD